MSPRHRPHSPIEKHCDDVNKDLQIGPTYLLQTTSFQHLTHMKMFSFIRPQIFTLSFKRVLFQDNIRRKDTQMPCAINIRRLVAECSSRRCIFFQLKP